jgi:hypothetical protein
MLPEDTKQRKEAALDSIARTQQTVLSNHFNPRDTTIVPYSDRAFEVAAIEWLVQTNQVVIIASFFRQSTSDPCLLQPIQAFKSPHFKTMVDIASRASKEVLIPSPKRTRAQIIHLFKQKMYLLRDRLNVGVSFMLPGIFTLTFSY